MTPTEYQRLQEIMGAALRLSPEERAQFIARSCATHPELRPEIDKLLAADAALVEESLAPAKLNVADLMAGQAAATSAETRVAAEAGVGAATHVAEEPAAGPRDDGETPAHVGPYRVLRALGRGGMGTVLLAVREEEQFKHRVAVKLLRKGMDTADVLRRFDLERQVLAALNHPHIARLLDAGETADGCPYFVMEYIEGQPIDEYCDAQGLSVDERLRLFRKVCGAVQFAHQNLIVHRDLKPGNILVGADGEPKLLDFGIAKLLNPELVSITVLTGPELRLMTPEYASPEQVQGQPISTASDVYALGVILYELLSGHRPYRFATRVQQELVRVICEVEPERPSTVVSRVDELVRRDGTTQRLTPEAVARARGGPPQKLRRRLSGDLDNIALKALQKVPRRRYASAEQLSDDIQRHLDGLPVRARPDSRIYHLSKFVRRNRVSVAAAAAIVLALAAGAAGTSWQWRIAEGARARAVEALAAAEQARDQADQAGALAERRRAQFQTFVTAFVDRLREIRNLEGATAAQKVLAGTLEKVTDSIEDAGADDPQAGRQLAEIHLLVGDVAGGIRGASEGMTGRALAHYERAVAILEPLAARYPGDEALGLALGRSHLRVGDARRQENNLDSASAHYETAVVLCRTAWAANPRDVPGARVLASALEGAGDILLNRNERGSALVRYREARNVLDRLRGTAQTDEVRRAVSVSLNKIARALADAGELTEALESYLVVLDLRRGLHERAGDARSKRDLSIALERVGEVLLNLERPDEAESHIVAAQALARELRDVDPENAQAVLDLIRLETLAGELQLARGQSADAVASFGGAIAHAAEAAALGAASGELQFRAARAHHELAHARGAGDSPAAVEEYRQAVELYREVLRASPENAKIAERLAEALADCAAALEGAGATADAVGYYTQAVAVFEDAAQAGALSPVFEARLARVRAKLAELAPGPQ